MDFKVIKEYEKHGRKIAIVHAGVPEEIKQIEEKFDFRAWSWYCGYVQVRKYLTEEQESDLIAPGGITYEGDLERYGIEGKFVGFDTAHYFTEDYTEQDVAKACEDLAKQLNEEGRES
ncbi:hypothetical protein FP435_04735 [Lactobacillus sp. PV037]|uniref:hypothetical protein n=1 Tax=Lactobacillus sp. PV037 TaxID=2594496 RepID=UPI0022406B79|nr:hypothetical protein [Lactobacillus sp. PV037]QNQ83797.1 hypothetical protein FP435_04735 [Lactobacillus sp. PV037]